MTKVLAVSLIVILALGVLFGVVQFVFLSVDLVGDFCVLVSSLVSGLEAAGNAVDLAVDAIQRFIDGVTDDMIDALPESWAGPVDTLMSALSAVVGFVGGILGAALEVPQAMLDAIPGVLGVVVDLCASR